MAEEEEIIEENFSRISTDLNKDGNEVHLVKLPNFLSVAPQPFDPKTYEAELEEEDQLDAEGKARLKLKVENTIRWKLNGIYPVSNTRLVKWSDGTTSLHLGSEIFNVYEQPLTGEFQHLFIKQGPGLVAQSLMDTKLIFRPDSTESLTHHKMIVNLADRSHKTSGIKLIGMVGNNPESHRDEMIKKEGDKLRAIVRRENQQKRTREKYANGSFERLSASYLEPDGNLTDEDGGISIAAIKNRYKRERAEGFRFRAHEIYTSDSSSSDGDHSDLELNRSKKLEKAKNFKIIEDSDEDEDEVGVVVEDDKNNGQEEEQGPSEDSVTGAGANGE